jgi:hypothetical protein
MIDISTYLAVMVLLLAAAHWLHWCPPAVRPLWNSPGRCAMNNVRIPSPNQMESPVSIDHGVCNQTLIETG